jgi:hypothetical protein
MRVRQAILISSVISSISSPALAAADPVDDAQLVARARAVLAVKEAPADRMLAAHKGVPVIVDVRCGDVCPQYTVRIIHYIVSPGPDCVKLGGDTANVMVPVSIAVRPQPFCIPHALYGKNLYTDHPYQK